VRRIFVAFGAGHRLFVGLLYVSHSLLCGLEKVALLGTVVLAPVPAVAGVLPTIE
jgi:hypothetical protein